MMFTCVIVKIMVGGDQMIPIQTPSMLMLPPADSTILRMEEVRWDQGGS